MEASGVRVFDTAQQAAEACSTFVLESLTLALQRKPHAAIAVSGGSTPRLLFSSMAKARFDWSSIHIFFVDERCVPPDDDQSNFKLANDNLLLPAAIPKTNIHRVQGELDPREAARRYVADIVSFFGLQAGELPVFDLLHRGIGDDAHTASLFPGEPLIGNLTDIAAAVWVEKMKSHRVTLLRGVLERAGSTVIQAAGSAKAEPIFNVLRGPADPMRFPCQIATRGAGNAVWFLDQAAAQKLQ